MKAKNAGTRTLRLTLTFSPATQEELRADIIPMSASRHQEIIARARQAVQVAFDSNPDVTNIQDLITDLIHLTEDMGESVHAMLVAAWANYDAERTITKQG